MSVRMCVWPIGTLCAHLERRNLEPGTRNTNQEPGTRNRERHGRPMFKAPTALPIHPSMMSLSVNPIPGESTPQSGPAPDDTQDCSALDALLAMMSACAPDVHAHARRVARAASATARILDLPAPLIDHIERAALLHDIGKLAFVEEADSHPFVSDDELQ